MGEGGGLLTQGAYDDAAGADADRRRVRSVGPGQMLVTTDPEEVLAAYGLGSCIAVLGYEPKAGVGGLLHALLPQSCPGEGDAAKFADTGIRLLVGEMERLGSDRDATAWYLVGGADVLQGSKTTAGLNIGRGNVAMAESVMREEGMAIRSREVGGSVARTVRLSMRDGTVTVTPVGGDEQTL
ncbi:MAG: chemotaxis protein CheD [Anaerolineae bacterium]|nr:chemotaxis protein CheD [Anaerolineae bacterium]